MIAFVALMLRHRWRRALTVCLLATFTYGVAVAVPAFLIAADRAMITNEVAHATTSELSLTAQQPLDISKGRDRTFESSEPSTLSAPWLSTTFSVAINVDTADTSPGTSPTATVPQLLYRQDYCAHLVLRSGRCPLTAREVLIAPDLASLMHVQAGGQVRLWWAYLGTFGWVASPSSITVSVVGIYQPTGLTDSYWGGEGYFTDGRVSPILTERGTIDALAHNTETQNVDAVLQPGAITDATIGPRRSFVAGAVKPGDTVPVSSQIPALLARISADRQTLREVLPDTAIALIMLGCFVLFLTISHGVADRTGELAVIRLRGARAPDRWWLGAGESLVPVALGIPVGLAVGGPLAAGVAALELPTSGGVHAATGGLLGAVTIVAMLVAVVSAHARPLSAPVTDLLRRIPARLAGWRAATAQTLVAALAAVAVVQLHLQPGPLTGIMLIAPALIVVALGLLAGPVVLPLAASVGHRSIARTRRLGLGLGALALARRPGAHLLLAVQVIALALVGFAAADLTAARHARSESVALLLGAPRVVDVGNVLPADLLRAVRTADPSGRYAMAVITLPRHEAADPQVIAVDAPRLAAVATWPGQASTPAGAVATKLHPGLPEPAILTGRTIAVTLNTTAFETDFGDAYTNVAGGRVGLLITLTPADGGAPITADLGNLTLGGATLRVDVPACGSGCRFTGLMIKPRAGTGLRVDTTVRSLTVDGKPVTLPLSRPAQWRVAGTSSAGLQPALSGDATGLEIAAPELAEIDGGLRVALIDAPATLPVVVAGSSSVNRVTDADGEVLRATPIGANQRVLPGVGAQGAIVDLEYLTRTDTKASTAAPGQVWLAARTPASVLTALAAAGVVTVADHTSTSQMSYLDAQGPAIGIGFGIAAAVAGVLLAAVCITLMAGVDRDSRARELRTLRIQGLSATAARRAATASQLGPVVLAAATGCVVAAAAWWLTGRRLPMFADGTHPDLPATAAPWWTLIAAVLAGALVLAVCAGIAARGLSRRVNR